MKRQQLDQLQDSRVFTDPMSLLQNAQMHFDYNCSRLENSTQRLRNQRVRLNNLSSVLLNYTSKQVQLQRQHLQQHSLKLDHHQQQILQSNRRNLQEKIRLLDAYSPLKILGRGYGLVYQDDHLIRSVRDVKQDQIEIRMQDGKIRASVTEWEEKQ